MDQGYCYNRPESKKKQKSKTKTKQKLTDYMNSKYG